MIFLIYLLLTLAMIVIGIFLIRNINIDGDLGLEEWLRVLPFLIGLFLLAAPFACGALQGKDLSLDSSYQSQPVQQSDNPKLTCVTYKGAAGWFHGGNLFSDSATECK